MTRRQTVQLTFEEVLELLLAAGAQAKTLRAVHPEAFEEHARRLDAAADQLRAAWYDVAADEDGSRLARFGRTVDCPACGAAEAALCVDTLGRPLPHVHGERYAGAARTASVLAVESLDRPRLREV